MIWKGQFQQMTNIICLAGIRSWEATGSISEGKNIATVPVQMELEI